MQIKTKRTAALLAAAVMVLAVLAAAGCDKTVMAPEPIEGPSQIPVRTEKPTPSPTRTVQTSAPFFSATAAPLEITAAPPSGSESASASAEATIEPTPEPTETRLEEGMTSPQVNELQRRLHALGYLRIDESELTEYYGPATRQAVELFQRQNGLEADGIAGQATLDAIFSESAPAMTLPLAGITIGLDPGHQAHGNNEHEPVAPGSSQTKPKVSSGTEGVATGVAEYVVNLEVGLRLRDLLTGLGANVLMTRDTNDVNISNAERATMMNDAGADLVVRLHCDGEDDSSRNGAFVLIPVGQYVSEDVQRISRAAAQSVLDAFIAETGANNLGLSERDDQTGFNWSTVPVINIEMGHMSNPTEDQKLVDPGYQQQCAQGIANGLVNYFS